MRDLRNDLTDKLVYYLHHLIVGDDTLEELYKLLRDIDYVDDDNFPIYEGDEDER